MGCYIWYSEGDWATQKLQRHVLVYLNLFYPQIVHLRFVNFSIKIWWWWWWRWCFFRLRVSLTFTHPDFNSELLAYFIDEIFWFQIQNTLIQLWSTAQTVFKVSPRSNRRVHLFFLQRDNFVGNLKIVIQNIVDSLSSRHQSITTYGFAERDCSGDCMKNAKLLMNSLY